MLAKYISLAIYFIILIIIGVIASRRVKGIKDYYVGGKSMGYWVVAFSARATGESGWLLLGLTGLGAMVGYSAFWVVVGEVLGVAIAWFVMAKPFKALSDQYDSITIPDYLSSRFNSQTGSIRKIAATALSIFVMIYVSAQIFATGEAFTDFLNMDFMSGAILGFIIVLVYSSAGGFVAVAWSDLFQGLVMLAGLVLLPIVAWSYLPEGISLNAILEAQNPSLTDTWGEGGFNLNNLFTILSFSLIGLGFLGSPQIFVRFMSIKDENEINKGRWVAIAFTIITDSAAVLTGILGRALIGGQGGADIELVLGESCESVLPMLVNKVMPSILIGIYIAAVLSAIMSTIDSLLVVASSAITRDWYQKIYNPEMSDEALAKYSKVLTIAIALIALALAVGVKKFAPEGNIFWFAIFGWSGLAATFCPTMIMSLFWDKFNEKGAIAAMIVGFACVPLFKFVINELPHVGPYFTKLDVLAPSFLISFLVGIVVANMTHKKYST